MESLEQSVGLKQLGRLFREQRRRQRLSQAAAAQKVGAKQSQISGFENGQPVLAEDKIHRLASFLEIDLNALKAPAPGAAAGAATITVVGYCSTVECPANLPFFIQGRVYIKPVFVRSAADGTGRCRLCGDSLVTRCVHCEATIREGLSCAACGRPYVEPPEDWMHGDTEHVRRQCEAIQAAKLELTRIPPAV